MFVAVDVIVAVLSNAINCRIPLRGVMTPALARADLWPKLIQVEPPPPLPASHLAWPEMPSRFFKPKEIK